MKKLYYKGSKVH